MIIFIIFTVINIILMFLNIYDIDLYILSFVDDVILEHEFQINKYINQIYNNQYFWYIKLKRLYPTIPITNINKDLLKKLYYKLKFNDLNSIVVVSNYYKYTDLLVWLSDQRCYEKFIIVKLNPYIKAMKLNTPSICIILLNYIYTFIFNHKFYLLNKNEKFMKTVKNKLYEFINEPEYKDQGIIFLKAIFNE